MIGILTIGIPIAYTSEKDFGGLETSNKPVWELIDYMEVHEDRYNMGFQEVFEEYLIRNVDDKSGKWISKHEYITFMKLNLIKK
jgi:hypothetical protein